MLGKVHERASVRDEPRANELTHHGQVRRDGRHALLQVLKKLSTILSHFDGLRAQGLDIGNVLCANSVPIETSATVRSVRSTSSSKMLEKSMSFTLSRVPILMTHLRAIPSCL